jgi:hypothetical protein
VISARYSHLLGVSDPPNPHSRAKDCWLPKPKVAGSRPVVRFARNPHGQRGSGGFMGVSAARAGQGSRRGFKGLQMVSDSCGHLLGTTGRWASGTETPGLIPQGRLA